MKKKNIRIGVFETNSSSTHSICIPKESNTFDLPEKIHFELGRFGWEVGLLKSISEKASYLYTGLKVNDMIPEFENIVDFLTELGIECTCEQINNDSFIDHGDELCPFLLDICSNKDKLLRFLFSELSFILTGNDNYECD